MLPRKEEGMCEYVHALFLVYILECSSIFNIYRIINKTVLKMH